MTLLRTTAALIAVFGASLACLSGESTHLTSTPCPAGREWAASLDQDAEVLRVERTFSQGGNAEGPVAPKTWSSRLEIRWQARWQAAPRFLV